MASPPLAPHFTPTQRPSTIGRFSRATFTPVEHKIYAWGAREQSGDFVVFDWRSREWSVCESVPSTWSSPGVRHAHTATHYVYHGRSYIVIYGGYDDEMHEPTTTHIFDTESRCWVEGATSGEPDDYTPTARSFHTATYACVDNEPYLFVVGGLHMRASGHNGDRSWAPPELCVLNMRTRKWYPRLNVLSRYGHAAVLIPGTRPRILILGGRDARGKHSSLHFMIDVLTVLDLLKVHHEPLSSSIGHLALSDGLSTSAQSCPWHSLGPFSNPIGPFNGTGNLWAGRIRNVVYVFGQSKGDSGPATDLFSDAPNQTLPFSVWTLKFDTGWCTFEDISTHMLPPSSGTGTTDRKERWMWFGVLDSGLKINRGDDTDEVDWNQVSTEPILFALNSARESPYEVAVEENSEWAIRCLAVPALALPVGVVESRNDNSGEHIDGWFNPSYARYLPPLWHPTQGNSELTSLSSLIVSGPDVAIHSSTYGAPPILAHSVIIGARSSYFRMLLSHDFGPPNTKRSIDSRDAPLKTTVDESYITTYSLVYFLYCSALPPLLLDHSVCKQALQSMPYSCPSQSSPVPVSPWARWAESVSATRVAADLLVAADKYLFPPSLSNVLRRCVMENHISTSNAVYIWRSAYLTRNQGDVDAGNVLMVRHTCNKDGRVGNNGVTPVNKTEEDWLCRKVREAYERRKCRPDSPARAFLAEVSRWCARRIDEIEPVLQVLEDSSSGTEDEDEVNEQNIYAVETDIAEAFWEEMHRMGIKKKLSEEQVE